MASPWSAELADAAASHHLFPQAPATVAEAVAAAAAAAAAAEAASAAAESALAAADVFAGSTIDLTGDDGGGVGFSGGGGARRYTPGTFGAAPPASGKRLGSLAAAEPPAVKRHRSDGRFPGLPSFGVEPGAGLLPASGTGGASDDGAGPGLLSLMMLRNR
jgi:hypothetical protein